MTTLLSGNSVRVGLLAAGLGLLGTGATQAQFLSYTTAGAANVAGTYADLGTAGAAIATANTDDANSAAQNIGFAFNYNGASFTQFVLNTNGFLKLGATAPSAANLFLCTTAGCTNVDPVSSTNAADVNLIMPFNFDLVQGTSPAEYRVATTGTAPNRVCTVQWKNVSDKADATPSNTQYTNFSFQVKLYEGSNQIEFVYGTATPSTATAVSRFPVVGLKGSGSYYYQTVLASKTTGGSAWSTTAFITANYTGSTHNFRNSFPPDAGRTYRFATAATDATLATIFTQGKINTALNSPVAASAVVLNTGTTALTNVAVTLTVSGATTFTNTQTVASLAPGAGTLVTFAPYPVVATSGTNNLSVSVAPDGLAGNNTQTFAQTVGTGEVAYVSGAALDSGVGLNAANGVFAVRYQVNGAASVTAVMPAFFGATAMGTTPTYQVQIYDATGTGGAPGTLLYTSPTRTRPAAGGPDVVAVPSVAVSGSFYVGVKNLTADNLSIGYQVEGPLRGGTFVFTTDGTTWNDLSDTDFGARLAINATVAPRLATRTQLGQGELSLSPNPARNATTLHLPALPGARSAQVAVVNNLGQVVRRLEASLQAAGTQLPLDLNGLAAGVYTVRVQAGEETAAVRLTVE